MAPTVLSEGAGPDILLPAMDENLWGFWRDYGRTSGADLHEGPDLRWFASGIPLAVFNGVPYARLSGDGAEAALALIQASVDRRCVPAMWWIGPSTQPADLALRLENRGFPITRIMIGMVVQLAILQCGTRTPAEFRIERVQGSAMQRLWARLLAEGSGFPDDAAGALAELEPTLADADYRASPRYLGFLADRPVATSALVLKAGLAGVYAVSTLPAARRLGIGAAMTARPLSDAQAQGYRLGILQATAMGHPVYKALGFTDVCRYRCYTQGPSASAA